MNSRISNTYYDRYRRELREEETHASRLLSWMYNTVLGNLATELFLKRRAVSRLYGRIHRLRWSRKKIVPFVRKMGIDPSELSSGIDGYATFHDFFIRETDYSQRPVNPDPGVCVCPVDGKVLAYASVSRDAHFRIKRSSFNLSEFVRNEAVTESFSGGAMAVCRLNLADNHHFHFPDSGFPSEPVAIEGFCHAGGPYSLQRLTPFFSENRRVLTSFESDHFSSMLIVEIGALTVGSIIQAYSPGTRVAKGDHKGYFDLGSTVVLLFRKGTIKFDPDLLANTERDIETYVRYGDSLGRVPGSARAQQATT
jgi:phosphatidylserine decarboxylase